MNVVILAGGRGTRLSEETDQIPKPMVCIGGQPILWHILFQYAQFGLTDFLVASGYRGNVIEEYFESQRSLTESKSCGQTLDMTSLNVQVIDTGVNTETAGRVKRIAETVSLQRFMMTWGDGVADVNIASLLEFHRSHGKLATVTAVRPPSRFGHLSLNGDCVAGFQEKPAKVQDWINGAYFVLEPEVVDFIDDDSPSWEFHVMPRLVANRQLMAYRHYGFWQCMDTSAERDLLRRLCHKGNAPWLSRSQRCALS